MDPQSNGGGDGEEGFEDDELGIIIDKGVATANGLGDRGEEAGVGDGKGVSLAMEVRVGDELLNAVKDGFGDLEEAGGGGGDEGENDGLEVREGEVKAGAIMEGARKGGGVEGGGIKGGKGKGGIGKAVDEGFALRGKLRVALAP